MKLSREEVRKIAHLARLGLTEEETERFSTELTRILDYVEKLGEADVEEAPSGGWLWERAPRMREDDVRPGLERPAALEGAPDATEELFRVPSVLPTQEAGGGDGPEPRSEDSDDSEEE